ncbi:MAG: type IV secretion system DNA-binding domain-containing protein [Parcubacteria group bacterium]
MNDINFFAKTNFRNQERIFGIKKDDRTRHMYVIGKTGMGKTNLLETMAIQDIRNGEGVCVVDPHGEFAEKMLRAIPSARVNDVVYFNPADKDFPIAFNILEAVDEDKKNLVASGMMGVFKKIWPDVWSPRMEYILNNTILALLDYPGSTMLGVNRMMFDKDYRKRVYPKIKDPVVKSFWINEFDKWEDKFRKEAVAAIQNKVGQFLSSYVIRNIVGQPKSTIDMREIMDKKKILIVNLSKGRIGEDAMRLLGGMIVTKIQLAAMGRVEIPEEERADFYLYVDEFQNFATESFANILSEARKYRLNLVLAHQYINQLIFDGNTTVRDAIFGNVGTIVTFRVGAEDAEFLEKEFDPVFLMNDIVNLGKYNVYLKLMIDGIAGDAFSATTLPPLDLSDTILDEEKAIRISRERYGKNRAEVEDRISRWSGMMEEENENIIIHKVEPASSAGRPKTIYRPVENVTPAIKVMPKAAVAAKPVEKVEPVASQVAEEKNINEETLRQAQGKKELYETLCDTCEQKIYVPFMPDPNRPAFCKECLKDYQRAMAKSRSVEHITHNANTETSAPIVVKPREAEKRIEDKVYAPKESPMSLSQMAHIAPKKFKPMRPKPNVDLASVRDLIKKTKE